MINATRLLENAKNRILDRKHWTMGNLAADSDGLTKTTLDPEATCYCSLGALAAEATIDTYETSTILNWDQEDEFYKALGFLEKAQVYYDVLEGPPEISDDDDDDYYYDYYDDIGNDRPPKYMARKGVYQTNDVGGHTQALEMFDRAIALSKENV